MVTLWRNPRLLALLAGQVISGIGDQIYLLVLPWLIFDVTRSSMAASTMRTMTTLPFIIFGLVVGVVVDRWDRRRLMLGCVAGSALLISLVPMIQFLGQLRIWHLYVIGFFISTVTFLFDTAYESTVPLLVDRQMLGLINGQLGIVWATLDLVGPALAGFVIAFLGITGGLWLDVISFGALMAVVIWLRIPRNPVASQKAAGNLFSNAWQGIHFIRSVPVLYSALAIVAVCNISLGMTLPLILFDIRTRFGLESRLTGLLFSMGAAGAYVGNPLGAYLTRKRFSVGGQFSLSLTMMASGMAVMGISTVPWLFATGYILQQAGAAWTALLSVTLRQSRTPDHMLGRVTSVSYMLARTTAPLAMILGGILSLSVGAGRVFLCAGLFMFIPAIAALATPLRHVR